ncbi:glycerophosphodiester phosphodiesterase [Arthrobacter sp. H14-L1]|uniref:glycerophosphodiester phosphodiesterase n=1 Tax=Arthrobacter sp. H14-L1 TaxID=2996697 RepID=UPI00227151D0|nr:glycerophosphodiester phosphodiesterase [Arthrobacter sp. H14-L1]MCY0905726.1 glycerophosphodiester phosphodiesterase [Arthrobacter sp. H14-L1]
MDPTVSKIEVSRRRFLLATSSVFLLGACAAEAQVPRTAPRSTVDGLLGSTPFYIAHRGSGDNWTEHTELAYSSALAAGAKAIEVSVQATADGTLICHHDTNLLRMTGADLNIVEQTYATVAALRTDARQWLGPATAPERIPLLKEVLDAHAANNVIFLEDKQGTNTKTLLDLMDTYRDSTSHFVWKQPAGLKSYRDARERGYKTWGYFMDGTDGQFPKYAPNYDLLGIYHTASDNDVLTLVGYGKPTIAWEVHTRWMRDRLIKLGVQGLMCANIPYVPKDIANAHRDTFATGRRNSGDLPSIINWKFQPPISPASSSIALVDGEDQSYSMGSLCPVAREAYALGFQMRWPDRVVPSGGAGVAFGQLTDEPYLPLAIGRGGYHLLLDARGTLTLSTRNDADVRNSVLFKLPTRPPSAGEWIELKVTIDPTSIKIARTGSADYVRVTKNTSIRGGYFSLCKAYNGEFPVEFRAITIDPV